MEAQSIAKTTSWAVDPAHSQIQFKVKHLLITTVTGSFKQFEATAETENDDFGTAKVTFTAHTASVDTGSEQRDQHLRSADFFNSEFYPEMSFVSTGMTRKNENSFEMQGNLTIRNITKPVTLNVEYAGMMKDPWGNMKAGFELSGKINRKEWELNWNAPLEAGGVLVADDVNLHAEIQLAKTA